MRYLFLWRVGQKRFATSTDNSQVRIIQAEAPRSKLLPARRTFVIKRHIAVASAEYVDGPVESKAQGFRLIATLCPLQMPGCPLPRW
jgi:hypothetical protein